MSKLTCSYSSVIAFGSSCLWNHIMYLVWNLQDCFFKAFAAKYCALVPWNIYNRSNYSPSCNQLVVHQDNLQNKIPWSVRFPLSLRTFHKTGSCLNESRQNWSRRKSEERVRGERTGMEARGKKRKRREGGARLAISYCEILPTTTTLEKLFNRYNWNPDTNSPLGNRK